MTNVYRNGAVYVRGEQCENCLLSPDRLVSGKRARQLVAQTRVEEAGTFICHKSQISDESEAICAAWWDAFADEDPILRLAQAMDVVVRTEVEGEDG